MKLSAVIFDLDDTLYNEADYVDQALAHTAAFLAEHAGMPDQASRFHARMRELLAQHGRGKIFDLLCEDEHLTVPVADLVTAYRATQPQLTLYPDAEALLQTLTAAQILTAVITDGCAAVQHTKLRALHLDERMDYCLVTNDYALSKPAPEVYTRTLSALGCAPDRAAYIGDNPCKDFIGAKALGIHTFRIVRPTGMHMADAVPPEQEADYTINALTELTNYLNL